MRHSLLLFSLALLGASEVFAKRVSTYVAPPYGKRALISLFSLLPMTVVLSLITFAAGCFFDRASHGSAISRLAKVAIVLWLLGAAIAASDAGNDESWNPAMYGAAILAVLPAAGLRAVTSRFRVSTTIITMVVLWCPVAFVLWLLGSLWQDVSSGIGLPTVW